MAMVEDERLKAALNMIRVTPENYHALTPAVIVQVYEVIADTEKLIQQQKDEKRSVHKPQKQ